MLINSGTSRSLVLSGNIHDLFFIHDEEDTDYIPLVPFLTRSWDIPGFTLIVYELNGPIRFVKDTEREKVKQAFNLWRGTTESDPNINPKVSALRSIVTPDAAAEPADASFTQYMNDAIGSPTLALELLRQFCLLSRSTNAQGEKLLSEKLIIFIEAADMLLPEGEIRSLSLPDRHRVSIVQDWISDSNFMNGNDTVIFITESASLVNSRIIRLPQVLTVEIPSPGMPERQHFVSWFNNTPKLAEKPLNLWGTQTQLAILTAGLSIQALRQLLLSARYSGEKLDPDDVINKVSEFIQGQLGEDVVEFKKPAHSLKDIVGNQKLVDFLKTQLIPRITSTGPDAISGMRLLFLRDLPVNLTSLSSYSKIFEVCGSDRQMLSLNDSDGC